MPFLAAFAAILAAAALLRSSWERKQLKTEKYTVKNAYAPERMRIAFISDVHNRLDEKGVALIMGGIREENPGLVILGGDIFTYRRNSTGFYGREELLKLIAGLSSERPVFYAEGNHEQRYREEHPAEAAELLKEIEKAGAVALRDSHVIYAGLSIYAVSPDYRYYEKRRPFTGRKCPMPESYLLGKLGTPEKCRMNILLLHTPLYHREAAAWGADLVLSGHFHGGTIRLPHFGGLMTPQFQFFSRECSGMHKCGSSVMIVSRGVGTHSVNIRLNDLPEISIIDIVPENAPQENPPHL